MNGHRKQVRHFHEPGDHHGLTFSCYRRMPLLTNDEWRTLGESRLTRAGATCHRLEVVHSAGTTRTRVSMIQIFLPFTACRGTSSLDWDLQLLKTLVAQGCHQWHPKDG